MCRLANFLENGRLMAPFLSLYFFIWLRATYIPWWLIFHSVVRVSSLVSLTLLCETSLNYDRELRIRAIRVRCTWNTRSWVFFCCLLKSSCLSIYYVSPVCSQVSVSDIGRIYFPSMYPMCLSSRDQRKNKLVSSNCCSRLMQPRASTAFARRVSLPKPFVCALSSSLFFFSLSLLARGFYFNHPFHTSWADRFMKTRVEQSYVDVLTRLSDNIFSRGRSWSALAACARFLFPGVRRIAPPSEFTHAQPRVFVQSHIGFLSGKTNGTLYHWKLTRR